MATQTLGLTGAGRTAGRAFDHVLIIMFENQYRGYVLGNPYMRRLARQGIQLWNYFGVMHPSQTNCIASIAGELCNVTNDDRPPLLSLRAVPSPIRIAGEADARPVRQKSDVRSFSGSANQGARSAPYQ